MTWGLRTAITISALAGLGQAFKGLNIVALSEISNWLLSFAMGAGVTALEYFGGDMIGVELVRYELDKLENKRMFDEQDQDWFANARKQFPSWVLRKTNKRTHHPVSEHTKQQTTNVRREYREQTTDGAGEQTIRTYLEQTFANEQRVLGVSELARMIAANEHSEFTNEQVEEFVRRTKGYISQVRTRWINQKGDMV